MNNTRTVEREGFTWTLASAPVKGHTPYSRQVTLKRDGEFWATIKLKHTGAIKFIPVLPSYQIPDSVVAEIRKDLLEVENG